MAISEISNILLLRHLGYLPNGAKGVVDLAGCLKSPVLSQFVGERSAENGGKVKEGVEGVLSTRQ